MTQKKKQEEILEQDIRKMADIKVPKIVNLIFDFCDAVQDIIHPPKSDKQLYVDAIKRTQKEFPDLAKHFLLPDQRL